MSFSRSDFDDRCVLENVKIQSARVRIVDDALSDIGHYTPRVLLRVAAARFQVPRTFRSKHNKRIIKASSSPAIGILGGCIAIVGPGSIRVVAIYKPTVLTTTTAVGDYSVTSVIDKLKTIVVPTKNIRKVQARTATIQCGHINDIKQAIIRGRKEKLTTWMRPIKNNIAVGMYQSRASHELVCITCGKSFKSYASWQKHTGNETVAEVAMMVANQEDKLIQARMKPPDGSRIHEPRSGTAHLDHKVVYNRLQRLYRGDASK